MRSVLIATLFPVLVKVTGRDGHLSWAAASRLLTGGPIHYQPNAAAVECPSKSSAVRLAARRY
jgi:hypothetical protein